MNEEQRRNVGVGEGNGSEKVKKKRCTVDKPHEVRIKRGSYITNRRCMKLSSKDKMIVTVIVIAVRERGAHVRIIKQLHTNKTQI